VTGWSWTDVLASGDSAWDTAARIAADPAFPGNPPRFIGPVSVAAAEAWTRGRRKQSRYFTVVGLLLVEAAGSPHISVGASLGDLRDSHGITDADLAGPFDEVMPAP
jgi:hypothetical protein